MTVGVVDRLQAIDIEHDQCSVGVIAMNIRDRAAQLALEAAAIGNAQQEIGFGRGLELFDPR